jgi:hypothetical protein
MMSFINSNTSLIGILQSKKKLTLKSHLRIKEQAKEYCLKYAELANIIKHIAIATPLPSKYFSY